MLLLSFKFAQEVCFVDEAEAVGGNEIEVCFFAAAMRAECLRAAGAGGGFLRFLSC